MINIIYVIFWGVISFISAFAYVLDGNWSNLVNEDILNGIFSPIFIWIIAFFGDYLYTIFSLNKETQKLDATWTKISYILIEIIFVILLLNIHWTDTTGRIICIIALFISMLGLKAASLYVLCPRQKIISI